MTGKQKNQFVFSLFSPLKMATYLLILNFVFSPLYLSQASVNNQIPSIMNTAGKALIKIHLTYPNGNPGGGTGFVVQGRQGKTFIVTNFHVMDAVLSDGAKMQLEDVSGQFLEKNVTLEDFDIANDIALLGVENYKGHVLPVSDFNNAEKGSFYTLGFPIQANTQAEIKGLFSSRLRYSELTGLFSDTKNSFTGYTYLRLTRGNSGGPLIDKEGSVVGVVSGGQEITSHQIYGTNSTYLKEILFKSREQDLLPVMGISGFIKKQVEDLALAANSGEQRAALKMSALWQDAKVDMENNEWFKLAVAQGDNSALYKMGRMYQEAKQPENAKIAYQSAAETGNPDAMFRLGHMLWSGEGVPKDIKKGMYWIEKAVERKNPFAIVALALIYINTRGLPKTAKRLGLKLLREYNENTRGLPKTAKGIGLKLLNAMAERGVEIAQQELQLSEPKSPFSPRFGGTCHSSFSRRNSL